MKNWSPLRLVQAIILGTTLIVAAYAADWLPFHAPDPKHHWMILWDLRVALLVEILPFCIGLALAWRGWVLLARGIRQESWTQSQLAKARTWSESELLRWYIILLAIGSAAVWFIGLMHNYHWNAIVLILTLNPLLRLRTMLKPPPPARAPYEWMKEQRPFFSSHWGEAPAPHGATE